MYVDVRERRDIADELRGAVRRSALTQTDFASLLGTSATRLSTYLSGSTMPSAAIYRRAIRLARALEYADRHGLLTPDATAEAVGAALERGEENFGVRLVLESRDHLRSAVAESTDHDEAWRWRHLPIRDHRLDTFYRAVIGNEFTNDPPEWTTGARLPDAWVVPDPFRDEGTIRDNTPPWLADANVFIVERGLTTA